MKRLFFYSVLTCFIWFVKTDWQENVETLFQDFKILGMTAGGFNSSDWIVKTQLGVRLFGDETPIGPEDRFYLGSASKTFTGVLAARVVESGVINWNSTVKEVLMDTALVPWSNIHENDTLWDLVFYQVPLPMSSVFNYESYIMSMADDLFSNSSWGVENQNDQKRLAVAQLMFNWDWKYEDKYCYITDLSYTMATVMLEAVTGKEFETLLEEEVFGPLSISGCHAGPSTLDPSTPPIQPWNHLAGAWGVYNIPITPGNTANDASWLAPDKGISCNADSLKTFMGAITGGGDGFLSQESTNLILGINGGGVDCYEGRFTLGWQFQGAKHPDDISYIYNAASGVGTSSVILGLVPDLESGALIMSNTNMQEGMRQQIGFMEILRYTWTTVTGCEEDICPVLGNMVDNDFSVML